MDSIYIIAKNEHGNPKTPVRWGRQGGGAPGYCLHNGEIVCFASFEEADKVLETFSEPYWFDIVEYRKQELVYSQQAVAFAKLSKVRDILNNDELCAEAMVAEIGELVNGEEAER